jgi:hypothetical protein
MQQMVQREIHHQLHMVQRVVHHRRVPPHFRIMFPSQEPNSLFVIENLNLIWYLVDLLGDRHNTSNDLFIINRRFLNHWLFVCVRIVAFLFLSRNKIPCFVIENLKLIWFLVHWLGYRYNICTDLLIIYRRLYNIWLIIHVSRFFLLLCSFF